MFETAPDPAPGAVLRPAEVRQRWRLTFRRRADAPLLTSKEAISAWESGLAGSGLPIAGMELPTARGRLVFGAPLAPGMPAERELLDLFLVARWPVARVRDALDAALPPGHEIVDLHDVWLGEPPLQGQVAAAEYRVRVHAGAGRPLAPDALQAACVRLAAASTLPRVRDKGGRAIPYDLRPLVGAASATGIDPDGQALLQIRTCHDPERGVGRPEEVVAALSDLLHEPLRVVDIVRERLILIGEA